MHRLQDLRNRLLISSRRDKNKYRRSYPGRFHAQAVYHNYAGSIGASAMPSLRRRSLPQYLPDVRHFTREWQNRGRHIKVHRLQALPHGVPIRRD